MNALEAKLSKVLPETFTEMSPDTVKAPDSTDPKWEVEMATDSVSLWETIHLFIIFAVLK